MMYGHAEQWPKDGYTQCANAAFYSHQKKEGSKILQYYVIKITSYCQQWELHLGAAQKCVRKVIFSDC